MNRISDYLYRLKTAHTIKNGLLVDIGSTATRVFVIANSHIISTRWVGIGDDTFNEDIVEYMGRMHNVRIDVPIAKQIKASVGSALLELTDGPEAYTVIGPNKITHLPMRVPISYQEISHCLQGSIRRIERAMAQDLENIPYPVVVAILEHGVCLSGVGSNIRGLQERLSATFMPAS